MSLGRVFIIVIILLIIGAGVFAGVQKYRTGTYPPSTIYVKIGQRIFTMSITVFREFLNVIKKIIISLRNAIGNKASATKPEAAKLLKKVSQSISTTIKKPVEVEAAKIMVKTTSKPTTIQDHIQIEQADIPLGEYLIELEVNIDNLLTHPWMPNYYDFTDLNEAFFLLIPMVLVKNADSQAQLKNELNLHYETFRTYFDIDRQNIGYYEY